MTQKAAKATQMDAFGAANVHHVTFPRQKKGT